MCMLNWLSIVKLIVKSFKNVYKKYTKKDLDTQPVYLYLVVCDTYDIWSHWLLSLR